MKVLGALRALLAARLRRRLGVPSISESLQRLQRAGFAADAVIDVGAYRGDFAATVLEVWPNASVTCFEPLPGRSAQIRDRFRNKRVAVHAGLLGAASGEAVALSVAETASSVLLEHAAQRFERIPMVTRALDDLVAEGSLAPRCDLLKLDVQGYELAVLRGAEVLLQHTSAILIELNLLDIHVGVPLMNEVIAWLAERGFVPWDVAGLTRRPLDDALWQIDLVMLRADSPLRRDKRWKA
jgi:FkbM family methyltransferase